jgi:hypothetical protein
MRVAKQNVTACLLKASLSVRIKLVFEANWLVNQF